MSRVQAVGAELHQRLQETSGTSLVVFTGPSCGSCRHLMQVLHEHAGMFADLAIYEVDIERDMGLAREFEVFHLPALFLFREGEYHCALHCETLPHSLREGIDTAMLAPAEEAP